MKTIKLLFILLTAATISGCSGKGINLKSSVSGKAGEVVVVTNKGNWDTEAGAALKSVLAVDYPFLPQKEPAFTLINIPENSFSSIFQKHRNIVILKTGENFTESKINIQDDIWAAPQTVVNISAPTEAEAAALILEKKDLLFNTLEQAERNRIIRNSIKYEELSLRKLVNKEFGGSPYFPKGYSLKKQADNFLWISYETTYTNQGIFVYSFPYKDSTSLQLENILDGMNEVMEKYVPGMIDNSYMTISNYQMPQMKWMRYKKMDFAEIRGFWEVQNDFMGGPFVAHIFYDKKTNNLLVLEGFVYSPRYDKRNYLRQVESIIYSFSWDNEITKRTEE